MQFGALRIDVVKYGTSARTVDSFLTSQEKLLYLVFARVVTIIASKCYAHAR